MDREPKGTPNPLNPNMVDTPLDANPSEPIQPAKAAKPTMPVNPPRPRPAGPTVPMRSATSLSSSGHSVTTNMPSPRRSTVTNSKQPVMNVAASKRVAMGLSGSNQPAMKNAHPEHRNQLASSADTARPMQETNRTPSLNSAAKKDTEKIPDLLANLGVVTDVDGGSPETIAPTNHTGEKLGEAKIIKPKKGKKKKALIVGVIVCLFIAIGCAVAACLLAFNPSRGDAVAKAIDKIITGKAPSNVTIDGKLDFNLENMNSPFTNMSINLGTQASNNPSENSTMATVTAGLSNGNEISFKLSEIYTSNEELYLKVDGIEEMFNGLYPADGSLTTDVSEVEGGLTADSIELEGSEEVDCYIEDGCPTSPNKNETESINTESLNLMSNILQTIDGTWIRVPLGSLDTLSFGLGENKPSCIKESVESLDGLGSTLAKLYKDYPFVSSTDENVGVSSVSDTIYKVSFNKNFASFANSLENSAAGSSSTVCAESSPSKSFADILRNLQNSADLFAEVDQDYNFTRLYFTGTFEAASESACPDDAECYMRNKTSGGTIDATVDLRFSYPNSIDASEPIEYQDLNSIIQSLTSSLLNSQTTSDENSPSTTSE